MRILLPVLLVACGGGEAKLEKARALWLEAGSDTYTMSVQHECLCPDTSPVQVVVVASGVRSAIQSGITFESSNYERWFTIDGLFEEIEDGLAGENYAVEVDYDPENGHPAHILIDPDQLDDQDDLVWTVTNLQLNPDG